MILFFIDIFYDGFQSNGADFGPEESNLRRYLKQCGARNKLQGNFSNTHRHHWKGLRNGKGR